jgi:Replication initiator protein, pSAM2
MTEISPADGGAAAIPGGPPARPGSRADRMAQPVARDVLTALAEEAGVCVRPLAIRRTDLDTGVTEFVDVPCGARLASKCKPCAERNRRLRRQQIREGWHLEDEPVVTVEAPAEDVKTLVATRAHLEFDKHALMFEPMAPGERVRQLAELDEVIEQVDDALSTTRVRGHLPPTVKPERPKRVRSTRRRADVVELPRLPVDKRTVGKVFRGKDGKPHRPSTLLTITLDSNGPVHTALRPGKHIAACECGVLHGEHDERIGTPLDPQPYNYRAAALDAIHFARVLDRFWQNLRRAAGWSVQYAGAVELQRRLAPHAHFAVRGTVPRALMRMVAKATYHQVWWPAFDKAVYTVSKPPVWDAASQSYVDPKTGQPLTSWDAAVDAIAEPAYVVRLGRVDARGIEAGTKDASRAIRYVTKYLTKDLTETATPRSDAQQAHFDRLHAELSVLPCSASCANWLLYGVQPKDAKPGLAPGACSGKVHQRTTLGFTGRRVLISRMWSGKTLADTRADNRDWLRSFIEGEASDPVAADPRRYQFELARPDDPDLPSAAVRIMRSISERQRWRAEIQRARDGDTAVSATPQPVPQTLALAA